jgi:hypothetical protein
VSLGWPVQRRIMAATLPDIFGAVGVHSGLAGRAAGTCGRPSLQWRGGTIRQRCEGRTAAIVFHGDADRAVNPVNSDHVIANARQEAALTKLVTHGKTPGVIAYRTPLAGVLPSRRE